MTLSLKKALLLGASVTTLGGCASGVLNPSPNRVYSPDHDTPTSPMSFRMTQKSWVTPQGVACDGQWMEGPALRGTETIDASGRPVPVPAGQTVYRAVSLQCGSAAALAKQAPRPFTPQEASTLMQEEKQTRTSNGMVCSATGVYVQNNPASPALFGPQGEQMIEAFGLHVPQGYQMVVVKPFGRASGYGSGSGINCQSGTVTYVDSPESMSSGLFGRNVVIPRAPENRVLSQPLSGPAAPSGTSTLPGLTSPEQVQGLQPSDKPVFRDNTGPAGSTRGTPSRSFRGQGQPTGGDYQTGTRLQGMPSLKVPIVGGRITPR